MAEDSNEFYWDSIFIKVEDKLFCVPRCEFVQSSVFADMFLLSRPATRSKGRDRDHPVVLEGYKKDEFTCLLKVMYPTARSLIPGGTLELQLKKEEWVSVLKLSTIWNMTKIRQCAIHWLSTNATLTSIEKILLARAHRVGAWLDEALTSLTTCNPTEMPTLEDLAALGWETVARILWIRRDSDAATRTGAILRFRRDAIRCMHCSSSSSLINYNYCCGHIASGDTELTGVSMTSGSASPFSGTTGTDLLVELKQIQCLICLWTPFQSSILTCDSCLFTYHYSNNPTVRVTLYHKIKTMAEEMFGDEIKDLQAEPATVADKTNYFDTSRGPGKHEIA